MAANLSLGIDKKEIFIKMAKDEIKEFLKYPTLSKEYKEVVSSMMINEFTHQLEFDVILENKNISSIGDWDYYIESLTTMAKDFAFAKKVIVKKGNDCLHPESGERIIELNVKSLGLDASIIILKNIFNKLDAFIGEYKCNGFIWIFNGEIYSFEYIK